jgi:hypothetical protein
MNTKQMKPPEKIRLTKHAAEMFVRFKNSHGLDYSVIAERLARAANRNPNLLKHRP